MASSDKEKHLTLAEELQTLWLEDMVEQYKNRTISSTDRATLIRFLSQNGFSVDPARMPTGLKDKLTSGVSPKDFEDDGKVLPITASRGGR
jgi:hypothetical protein